MKSLLIFLLGAVVGAFGYSLYISRDTRPHTLPVETTASSPTSDNRTFGEKAGDAATQLKDDIAAKAVEWHLTPADIKRDLNAGGKVVREKAGVAGGKIADARIVTVIKAKYVLDSDLSALDINVDCTNGNVVLNGKVASVELVSKALLLALDTDGVVTATSNLIAPF